MDLNLSLINISVIGITEIAFIYYYFKCKRIEERLKKLEIKD